MDTEIFIPETMVVYPAHGVGKIVGQETQTYAGTEISMYVVAFERDKMTLRIPVVRAVDSGLRTLCSERELNRVSKTLRGRPRTSRGMWSRRAKEYESKINSGNIVSLAEVVRDLHKNVDDPDRSYSERVIYENALTRLAGEISAVNETDLDTTQASLVQVINDNAPKEEDLAAAAAVAAAPALAPAPTEGDTDGNDNIAA